MTAAVLTLSGGANAGVAAGVPDREADPVVLTGSEAPALVGIQPDEVVAFRWNGAWKQVPVQVDERKVADFRVIRQTPTNQRRFLAEVYADPGTYVGADGVAEMTTVAPIAPITGTKGDPKFDFDDEVAMMSKDAGSSAAGKPDPVGVDGATRTPVRIKDPLEPQTVSYLYLFRNSSDLDPAAGTDYVSYDFNLDSGNYKSTYDWNGIDDQPIFPPANPETSVVQTPSYSLAFPARWMTDGLEVKSGSPADRDILDGDKSTVGPYGCGRNELTFSRGGGGFIANIDGPVRGIRSFIGANSGTYTQRDLIFYGGRFDTNTYLRVHGGIGNLVTAMDYSEGAKGMVYRNSLNPGGVTIDGVPDTVTYGNIVWEQVSGAQGSLVNVARLSTDIDPIEQKSFYMDDATPPSGTSMLCSGDKSAFGASGPWVTSSGPNTDPTLVTPDNPELKRLSATRISYVGSPNQTADTAILRSRQVDSPLVLATGAASDPTSGDPDPDSGPGVPDPDHGVPDPGVPNPGVPDPGVPNPDIGLPDPGVPNPGPDPGGTPGRTHWVGLKVRVRPKHARVRVGVTRKFEVKVRSIGDLAGKRIRVCPVVKRKLVRASGCRKIRRLKPGRVGRFKFRATARRAAAGKKLKLRFRAKASQSKARSAVAMLIVPFRR